MILSKETTIIVVTIGEEEEVAAKVVLEVDMSKVGATITNNLQEKVNKGNKRIPQVQFEVYLISLLVVLLMKVV